MIATTSSAVVPERVDYSDNEVIRQVLDGNTALFELLMRRYNERLYRAARAIVRDEDEAEVEGRVVGYCHVVGAWLDALYVTPEAAGRGIGTALLDLVRSLRPDGFALWVFLTNEPARRFYRRHGLVELGRVSPDTAERLAELLRLALASGFGRDRDDGGHAPTTVEEHKGRT